MRASHSSTDEDAAGKPETDAARFEMDAQSIANLREALRRDDGTIDDDVCEVWPEHWATVCAFVAVTTQWRTVSIGGGFNPSRTIFVGLDYSAARTGLEAEGIAVTPTLWRELRVMEAEACRMLNERAD